jgi:competence protein ComEC
MIRIKRLLWQARAKKMAAVMSLLPVFIYGVIAGFSPSTQRAVIMVTVFLLTYLFEREQDSLNTLSLAALSILVADPPSLFSISFQLSFSAVYAIIYGLARVQNRSAPPKVPRQENWFSRLNSKLVSFFLVSLFAICGSLPLVAYYFNQISLIGLAANFVVVPLIGFVSIPLGLMALFILPLSSVPASWCIMAATSMLSSALNVVDLFGNLPFAAVKIVTPSPLEVICFYIMGWALLNLRRIRPQAATMLQSTGISVEPTTLLDGNPPPTGGQSGLQRRWGLSAGFQPAKLAILAVLLVLLTLALDTCYWLYQRFWHADLRVTIIDVGHGSASLLELPGGYTILIDGGGFTDNSAFDVGERVIAPFLWRKKIRTVDTLILSHPNSDHMNGLIFIARHFHVKNIWTNNESRDTLGFAEFMQVIASKNIHRPVFEAMPRRYRINDVELHLLYPPSDYLKLKNIQKWRNLNNNSLVVKASLKSVSFLFPGDIMAEAEKELVDLAGKSLNSAVLIAPHHGSKTSSSQIFLNAVDPEFVIISAGRYRRFQLPHPAILKRYASRRYTLWRTDIDGAISLSTNGYDLEISAFAR